MPSKILVLGATRTIGKPLLTKLVSSGQKPPRGLEEDSERCRCFTKPAIEWCELDYFDRETYPRALPTESNGCFC